MLGALLGSLFIGIPMQLYDRQKSLVGLGPWVMKKLHQRWNFFRFSL